MGKYLYDITIKNWLIIGVFNLLVVALLGLLMRLKIILPLAFVNQQHIMHAHSHFAFSGWISQVLMVLLVMAFTNRKARNVLPPRYQLLLWGNLIASYGMLTTFAWQGYGFYSIAFSTLTVLLSYIFAVLAWKDINRSSLGIRVKVWFKAALVFLALSSIGTFYLAYLMKSGNVDPRQQLAAVYFFLHFQYNGWFFLMCMGLASRWFYLQQINIPREKLIQAVFVLGCIPAYMLSILWYTISMPLYIVLVVVVILQVAAWSLWVYSIWKNRITLRKLATGPTVN
ncbi:MAG TPA: hypothetical protein PKA53_06040, partial [Sphingobacterium sp.]|nr:hypothetical protein [Sphingobacterium sp.]